MTNRIFFFKIYQKAKKCSQLIFVFVCDRVSVCVCVCGMEDVSQIWSEPQLNWPNTNLFYCIYQFGRDKKATRQWPNVFVWGIVFTTAILIWKIECREIFVFSKIWVHNLTKVMKLAKGNSDKEGFVKNVNSAHQSF